MPLEKLMRSACLILQECCFDFSNEHWHIGVGEMQMWGRDTMVFDVWRNVFMMRMGAL